MTKPAASLPKAPTAVLRRTAATAERGTVIIAGVELPVNGRTPDADALPALRGVEKELQLLAYAAREDVPVLLTGDTGTGKTSLVRWLAHATGNEYRRLNLNGGTTADEFAGRYILDGQGRMRWLDGVLVDSMRRGHWLLLDEINAALPEVLFYLDALLDDDRHVVLAEKDGEIVQPHANFRLFATMNPSLEYAGTRDLNKAFLSRFPVVIATDFPTPAIEERILIERAPHLKPKEAALMVQVAGDLRKAHAAGEIGYICSTRDLISWATLRRVLELEASATYALLNRATGGVDEVKAIKDVLRLHVGKLADGKIASSAELQAEIEQREREAVNARAVVKATFAAFGLTLNITTLQLDSKDFKLDEFTAAVTTAAARV